MRIVVHDILIPGMSTPAKLTAYLPEVSEEIDLDIRRPAVIVCPGGAYKMTSDREAEPVALKLLTFGFNAFVLRYHVAPNRYPIPQLELASACAWVKKTAEETHTDADHVFVMGFSAGGHLAASLGVLWNQTDWAELLGLRKEEIHPAGMVLGYPVISSGSKGHQESFDMLLGDRRKELEDLMSLEKQVDESTVPAFLWHTFEDTLVNVENSLMMAQALKQHGILCELHVYPHGDHGSSLANEVANGKNNAHLILPDCQEWIELCARFLMDLCHME